MRNIREQFEKLIADASIVRYCFICGGVHDIEECPMQDDEKHPGGWTSMPFTKNGPSSRSPISYMKADWL